MLRRAHPNCPLESRWESSRERRSDDWQWQRPPFCRGWQRGVATRGMCNRTDRKGAYGGEARRSPAERGWTDSRFERRGEAASRVLRCRTPTGPWEEGTAPGRCCSGGGGARVGCRCSRVGSGRRPGRARSTGTWRAGEMTLRLLRGLRGFLRKERPGKKIEPI